MASGAAGRTPQRRPLAALAALAAFWVADQPLEPPKQWSRFPAVKARLLSRRVLNIWVRIPSHLSPFLSLHVLNTRSLQSDFLLVWSVLAILRSSLFPLAS